MSVARNKACIYCGSEGPITDDHVIPKSLWREFGIRRRVLDNMSNRVPACLKCNQEKANRTPGEWFEMHPEYRARFLANARYLSNAVLRAVEEGIPGGTVRAMSRKVSCG